MNIPEKFSAVPPYVFVFVFFAIFVGATLWAYLVHDETRLLEKKIEARQKDYAEVIQLKDSYEMKKRAFEKAASKKVETKALSLALMEDMVAKNFMGGSLVLLQPAAAGEGKGKDRTAVEVKVTGAPLGEVVSFLKAVENSGLYASKLRLSQPPSNATSLDIQVTVMEQRHG